MLLLILTPSFPKDYLYSFMIYVYAYIIGVNDFLKHVYTYTIVVIAFITVKEHFPT